MRKCFYWRLYIKPQRQEGASGREGSVSIGGYTSNHNNQDRYLFPILVFLLAVIHQTTTSCAPKGRRWQCFYWRLYIKPQLVADFVDAGASVSIGGYTSNHNEALQETAAFVVFLLAVIHQTTTIR